MRVTLETTTFFIVSDGVNIRVLTKFTDEIFDGLYYHMCGAGLRLRFAHNIEFVYEVTAARGYYCVKSRSY
jgi:hypothetical protein